MVGQWSEAQLIGLAVLASATGDAQGAGDVLQQIADGRPSGDMYPVCCEVASIGRDIMLRMVGGAIPQGAFWGILSTDETHPEVMFAQRFLVAYANGDADTCLALYRARESAPGHGFVDSVCALVIQVGVLARGR